MKSTPANLRLWLGLGAACAVSEVAKCLWLPLMPEKGAEGLSLTLCAAVFLFTQWRWEQPVHERALELGCYAGGLVLLAAGQVHLLQTLPTTPAQLADSVGCVGLMGAFALYAPGFYLLSVYVNRRTA